MTSTLPGADIRGFYADLGIQLPPWAQIEASVRCFADPDAHQRGDRDPSTSVNLQHGAWRCHACGARGGAYEAARTRGHEPRSAIELMIRRGLTERRGAKPQRRPLPAAATRRSPRPWTTALSAGNVSPSRPRIRVSESDLQRWHLQLLGRIDVLERLAANRGWSGITVRQLQLGLDDSRITIPVRDERRRLVGLLRFQPDPEPGDSKIRAAYGSRRALFPHPAAETSRHLLIVEGEPDAIAARSRGLPAIAIPGTDGWQPHWAQLFYQRRVTIALDADPQGRACARQIARELAAPADHVEILDIAPERSDGYDLTNWLVTHSGDANRIHEQLHQLQTPIAA